MATQSYKVAEARAHFSELLKRAQAGEEILITRGSEPIARLGPAEKRSARRPGMLRGLLSDAEIKALERALEAPLGEDDQRALEGDETDDLGIWIGQPQADKGNPGKDER